MALTKVAATAHRLLYNHAPGGTGTISTMAAATMLADTNAGPLREWLRKHRSDAASAWSNAFRTGEISITLLPTVNDDTNIAAVAQAEFAQDGNSVNQLRVKAVGSTSTNLNLVEIRYNHSLVR